MDTEVSKGTTFSFFLPITDQMPESELEILKVLRSSTVVPKTILLVEDEEEVRSAIRDLLTQKGFMIIEAKNGKQALAVAQDYPSPIHLLLTDMIMPEMGGKELAESLEKIMPNLRVLFMSGYTQDEAFRKDAASGRRCFIQKPFSLSILLAKVNEAMILEGTLA